VAVGPTATLPSTANGDTRGGRRERDHGKE
jgi:hypothetical protein